MNRLASEMPAPLFFEWIQFMGLEPRGAWRQDYNAAMIALQVARSAGAKGAKLSDFLLDFDTPIPEIRPRPKQSWEEIIRMVKLHAYAEGKT